MAEVKLTLEEGGQGRFDLSENHKHIGEMSIRIDGHTLIAYHTEVASEHEGKGYAKQLLQAMVEYARSHHLKVVPLCPYVHAQFQRHEEEYKDIWEKGWKRK